MSENTSITTMHHRILSYDSSGHHDSLKAPDGPALIHWLAREAGVGERGITDGHHTVAYSEVPRLLQEIDGRFAQCGITGEFPVALECPQSVPGALMLLHALGRTYDVVLLPDLGRGAKEVRTPPFIPRFCSHVIRGGKERTSSGTYPPTSCIQCFANQSFVREPTVATLASPNVYLRTSGSTGTPKLARMSHQKWLNNALACVERWKLATDDRLAVPVPIFHSYGLGAAFLPGLLVGAAMNLMPAGDIVSYLELERRFKPNVAFLTPAMCDIFLERRKTPRAYRMVVTAGDRIKRQTMAGFELRFGPLLNLYGSAEMGAVSSASPDDPPEMRIGTAGYPLAGIRLRTREVGLVEGVATGERVGVLQCRQANGFAGYLIEEERWRFEPCADDAWFEMGDLAIIRADGYVEIRGRSNLSVKRDGLLVAFADVEAALEKADGVQRGVLIASGENRRGSRLIGVCLAKGSGARPQARAVRQKCIELLPRYAVPDEVLIVDSLPRLPSGKIDRCAIHDSISKLADVQLLTPEKEP